MDLFETRRRRLRSDSGLSCSYDTVSLKDFKTQPVLSLDSFVKEKIEQMEKIAEDIKGARNGFLKKYNEMNKGIEYWTKQMYYKAEQQKQELKNQIEEIATTQVLFWDRQLNICKEAEDWLQNVKIDFTHSSEFLQETCNIYARDIGYIDSPEIIFDDGTASVQNSFENFEIKPSIKTGLNNGAGKTRPKFLLGRRGQNVGEFRSPWGICSDRTGRILVADCWNNRIQVFDERGRFLFEFGKFGTHPGYFNKPVGITVDERSRVLVTDQNNHRVQVFTSRGEFIFMFGKQGYKQGQFQYPWDVDTNSEGEIAISDTRNYRVQLFNKNGVFASEFRFENCIEELVCPIGVAFKPDDTLLVTDFKNNIIFKIDKTFSTAAIVQRYMNFHSLQGLACNRNGKIIVADRKLNKILFFDDKGNCIRKFGRKGKCQGEFENPQGVCFHPSGSIIVSEWGNNRIQVF